MSNELINKALIDAIKNQYQLHWDGIHGARHWARVRNIGLKLANTTGANKKIVELFAFLHDSCRLNDGYDFEHGNRAAVFVAEINAKFKLLSSDELIDLQVACRLHTHGLTTGYNQTILTCWDADRLDLGRVSIIPNPKYLCTDIAKQKDIIQWAYQNSIR